MVQPTPPHWPAVLWSLETASGFSQRTVYQTDRGKQPKSTSSSPDCPPTAVNMNSGLHPSSWANPTHFLHWYSQHTVGWQQLGVPILSSRTWRWPWGLTAMLQKSPDMTKELLLLPRHPSSSCTHLLMLYRHNQLPWSAGVTPPLT